MRFVRPEVTVCSTCGRTINGGPVCTFLPNALAWAGTPEVVKYHCGTCCPGHQPEPARLPERSQMVETAYRRAREAAERYAEGGEKLGAENSMARRS